MTYTVEQKEQAKQAGNVLFKFEINYKTLPKNLNIYHRKLRQEWGHMSAAKAQRIWDILQED